MCVFVDLYYGCVLCWWLSLVVVMVVVVVFVIVVVVVIVVDFLAMVVQILCGW